MSFDASASGSVSLPNIQPPSVSASASFTAGTPNPNPPAPGSPGNQPTSWVNGRPVYNAWTVAQVQAQGGAYDNSNNPAAAASLAADQKRIASYGPAVKLVGRVARYVSPERVIQLAAFQRTGQLMANADPMISSVRNNSGYDENSSFMRGFDVASAVCKDTSQPGPGQDAARLDCMALTPHQDVKDLIAKGYNVSQALQHGLTRIRQGGANDLILSADPSIAGGQLLATGLVGSNLSANDKAAAMQAAIENNPAAKQGAAQAIAVHKGFFQRIKEFLFGA